MFIGQLFEPNPIEKDLSLWDLYKGVTEDSMFHLFELDMEFHQLTLKPNLRHFRSSEVQIINLGTKGNKLGKEKIRNSINSNLIF